MIINNIKVKYDNWNKEKQIKKDEVKENNIGNDNLGLVQTYDQNTCEKGVLTDHFNTSLHEYTVVASWNRK